MLQAFLIALREGVEAALVIALLLAAVDALGRQELKKPVFLGLFAAVLGSIAFAMYLRHTAANEEVFEGVLMIVAALFVSTTMVFMWRASRSLKTSIGGRVAAAAGGRMGAVSLFAFTFFVVAREGAEAVLFLSASTLGSDTVSAAIGGLAGLVLAALFGYAFARGALRIDLSRFFKVTGLVLFILAFQLLLGGLHELGEAKIFRVSKSEMALVGPIVKNDVLFVIAIALIPLFLALVPGRAQKGPSADDPALVRKERARLIHERRLRFAMAALSIGVASTLVGRFVFARGSSALSPGTPVVPREGVVDLPLDELGKAAFHRFTYESGGTMVRFIVVRSGDSFRVALDACEICGAAGYNGDPGGVVCLLCDSPINAATIGRPGGCNPILLASNVVGRSVRIAEADLVKAAPAFKPGPR